MSKERIICKAPGKVLIAGGYGVLQQDNIGLTLAVDRYFYSVSTIISKQIQSQCILVSVQSPQIDQNWEYAFSKENSTISEIHSKVNPFLQNSVKYSLIYSNNRSKQLINHIKIIILQDKGFLSQQGIQNKDKFINYSKAATKTGLGSSAGVIVVVVQAILKHYFVQLDKETVNAISHVANLAAANKIGSNFDISTAVYGSHLYQNVLPRIAFDVIQSFQFENLLNKDTKVQTFAKIPNALLKCSSYTIDLRKGSNTRKMVSGFIKSLSQKQNKLVQRFYSASKDYVSQIYDILISQSNESHFSKELMKINKNYRHFLQQYSDLTNVPVQPPELRSFLDQISLIQGVIYTICPGSGGYDAIFVLSLSSKEQDRQKIELGLNKCCEKEGISAAVSELCVVWREEAIINSQIDEIQNYLKCRLAI